MLPVAHALSLPKKQLFTVGFPYDSLYKAVSPAESGWERLHSLYQHVKLEVDEHGSLTRNAITIVKDNDCLGRAAAAIVAPVDQQQRIIQQLRTASRTVFIICWHPQATEDATLRVAAFASGANMVTHCMTAVIEALHKVAMQQQHQHQQQQVEAAAVAAAAGGAGGSGGAAIACDWCGLPGLTATEYWAHQQLYHIYHHNMAGNCQICHRHSQNLARHIHDHHHPVKPGPELRTGVFALCIVRRPSDGKFLMTQEFAGSGFWVPGGGVDPGETLVQAAVRECWEEAGVEIVVKGILSLESHRAGEWKRVTFYAEPATATATAERAAAGETAEGACMQAQRPVLNSPLQTQQQQQHPLEGSWNSRLRCCPCCRQSPKTLPDFDSAGACWVSADELAALPLRSPSEPCTWFPALANGPEGLQEGVAPLVGTLEMPVEWAKVFKEFPCQ